MISAIKEKRETLERLCIRHRVRLLEVFGSATGESFDPATSDLDFLIEFMPMPPIQHADAFFGLQEELQQLFGMPVELVERSPIRNPYFLQSIEQTKVVLYAAA